MGTSRNDEIHMFCDTMRDRFQGIVTRLLQIERSAKTETPNDIKCQVAYASREVHRVRASSGGPLSA